MASSKLAVKIVAIMRTLTVPQQTALLTKAQEFARQNKKAKAQMSAEQIRSKPQKSDENAKVFATKAAMAKTLQSGSASSGTPRTKKNSPGECPFCHLMYWEDKLLQKHMKKRHKNTAALPDPPITEAVVPKKKAVVSPVRQRGVDAKAQKTEKNRLKLQKGSVSSQAASVARATPKEEWEVKWDKEHAPFSARSEPKGQKWTFDRYKHTGR